jgi:Uma2 family endonuclease
VWRVGLVIVAGRRPFGLVDGRPEGYNRFHPGGRYGAMDVAREWRTSMAITRYSVDDYEEMIRLGVLTENDRVELIRGEIAPKMSIGPKHAICVKGLNALMVQRTAGIAVVGIQDPVRLIDSEPEPDVSLVRPPRQRYAAEHPGPLDIFLIIEVADSSLDYDRDTKRPMYAEAGIAEYWIVNLVDDCLEVYRGPRPDGTYQDELILRRGESTDIAALPGVVVAVDEIL